MAMFRSMEEVLQEVIQAGELLSFLKAEGNYASPCDRWGAQDPEYPGRWTTCHKLCRKQPEYEALFLDCLKTLLKGSTEELVIAIHYVTHQLRLEWKGCSTFALSDAFLQEMEAELRARRQELLETDWPEENSANAWAWAEGCGRFAEQRYGRTFLR